MARDVVAITQLTATATVNSPLHIGTWMAAPGTAIALARDGCGRLVVPGSSLAGALRAAMGQPWRPPLGARAPASAQKATPAEKIWGAADLDGVGASRVVVYDAMVEAAQGGVTRRDGVAIDRAWGSAADELLYAREVVSAGAKVRLEIEVHTTAGEEEADRAFLHQLVATLVSGFPLGARTSRGLGVITASPETVTLTQTRYDSPDTYWETARSPRQLTVAPAGVQDCPILDIKVHWIPLGPVSVGCGLAPQGVAHLPLAEVHPTEPDLLRLVLPGTALAGALRSRAELICRTVLNRDTPDEFADQLGDAALVATLFGHSAGRDGATASPLVVHDCSSTTTIPASDWERVVNPLDSPDGKSPLPSIIRASKSNDDGSFPELRRTEHVGIDRWTGGASEGRLFCEYEPHGFRYQPIHLQLRRNIIPANNRDAATALLLLVLRELAAGRIPLGGRGQRGYGQIKVTRVVLRGAGFDHDGGDVPDLNAPALAGLRRAWRAYLGQEDTP